MIFIKQNSISGIIAGILKVIIVFIYKVLKFLNLRLLALLALIGVILYFADVFTVNPTVLTVYTIVVGASLALNIFLRIRKIVRFAKKSSKPNKVQIVNGNVTENNANYAYPQGNNNPTPIQYVPINTNQPYAPMPMGSAQQPSAMPNQQPMGYGQAFPAQPFANQGGQQQYGAGYTAGYTPPPAPSYPKYFKVKNSSCIMAEYADRYELYQKTPGGMIKLRTDYKKVQ